MQWQSEARHPMLVLTTRLRAGDTLRCVACTTSVVLMDVPADAPRPSCCGREMVTSRPVPCSVPQLYIVGGSGASAGCWYADAESGLVGRCTRGGRGYPACSGRPMAELDRRPDTASWA